MSPSPRNLRIVLSFFEWSAAGMAGVDLLLIAYDGEKAYDVLYALLAAERKERLDTGMLYGSWKRSAAAAARLSPISRNTIAPAIRRRQNEILTRTENEAWE